MSSTILVTGALGNVGTEVVQSLVGMGIPVRAADISLQALTDRFPSGVELVEFDFAKPETYKTTFDGITSMFLMRPPQITDIKRLMVPAKDAAQSAGVKHVVFLSLIGIEKARFVPHYKVEQHLMNSSMTWTFLRCSFFMQNLNTTHRLEIKERNEIFVPVGKARTSFIDVRDIGAAAAITMTQPGHERKAYDLTGPEALDYWQAADILSNVLGRRITYRNPSPINFFFTHLRRKTPFMFALVMTGLYISTRNGMAEAVTGEVERITGRKPITFRQYAADYQKSWS